MGNPSFYRRIFTFIGEYCHWIGINAIHDTCNERYFWYQVLVEFGIHLGFTLLHLIVSAIRNIQLSHYYEEFKKTKGGTLSMSFISVFATNKLISIVSDGRVSQGVNSVCEHYQKFDIYQKKFAAGTGNKNECERLRSKVLTMYKSNNDYSTIAEMVREEIIRIRKTGVYVSFVFGGKDNDGKVEVYTIDTDNPTISKLKVPESEKEFTYQLLTNNIAHDTLKLNELVDEISPKVKDIVELQILLNEKVSLVDSSVNTVIFKAVIN